MLGKGNNLVPWDLSYPRENLGTRLKKELTLLQLSCAFRALHSSPHSLTPPLFFPPLPSSPHFQLLNRGGVGPYERMFIAVFQVC